MESSYCFEQRVSFWIRINVYTYATNEFTQSNKKQKQKTKTKISKQVDTK